MMDIFKFIKKNSTISIALVIFASIKLISMDKEISGVVGYIGIASAGLALLLALYSIIEEKVSESYEQVITSFDKVESAYKKIFTRYEELDKYRSSIRNAPVSNDENKKYSPTHKN